MPLGARRCWPGRATQEPRTQEPPALPRPSVPVLGMFLHPNLMKSFVRCFSIILKCAYYLCDFKKDCLHKIFCILRCVYCKRKKKKERMKNDADAQQ